MLTTLIFRASIPDIFIANAEKEKHNLMIMVIVLHLTGSPIYIKNFNRIDNTEVTLDKYLCQ